MYPEEIKENRISLEQYNKELEEAEQEFINRDYITNEEMIKLAQSWTNQ